MAWSGTVHEGPSDALVNVVVERDFDEPTTVEAMQTIEDAGAWCMELHNVEFVRTFFSLDKKKMFCLYHAPDAESVRQAQRQAGMPVTSVWATHILSPK